MNRTIKEATVKRFHYDSHDQLRTHLADFMAAYNFARRLKTLGGLTPYEYICKIWTSEPDRFILNPIHQMPGLNNIPVWFFRDGVGHLRETVSPELFVVAEDWKPDVGALRDYLDKVDTQLALFDVGLHMKFHEASRAGDDFDLRQIFDASFLAEVPEQAVTFAENHDTAESPGSVTVLTNGDRAEKWVDLGPDRAGARFRDFLGHLESELVLDAAGRLASQARRCRAYCASASVHPRQRAELK
ncbi:hypothetical protein C8J30_1072 [Rhodobacter viridis]|uniref:Integrase catalytic domain-containing protein n=1 Tax=Rhodobacter viridis TaxID=1054202 RepID=A0A318U2P7_9RHOB|nr:hypothetical protein C8J30_1072 [Rhodobacter viridis]